MTQPAPAPIAADQPPAKNPDRVTVAAPPDSRLQALLFQRQDALAQADAAKRRAEEINSDIKAETTSQVTAALPPGGRLPKTIILEAGPRWPALVMTWVTPRKLNRKQLAAEQPATVANYTEWGTPYWKLDLLGGH